MISHRDTVTHLNGEGGAGGGGGGGGVPHYCEAECAPSPGSTSDTRVHRKLACMTS